MINSAFSVMLPKLMKKYTEGYDERRGIYDPEKLKKFGGRRPLWIHAVSVGEVLAAMPLIRAARAAGWDGPVALSTTTETGKAMAFRIGQGVFDLHIYYPWDKSEFIKSALEAVNPLAFVAMETELWPNMLWGLKDRDVPAFLANGRISNRTDKKLRTSTGKRVGREIFDLFSALYLRAEEDKKRLSRIGIAEKKLIVTGDGKIDALLERKDREAQNVEELRVQLDAERAPIFIAGSLHVGEDSAIIDAFLDLRKHRPDVRLIIAPRHPERAQSVKIQLPPEITTYMLSAFEKDWECLVVDKIGHLFNLYALGTAAFVGGSLVAKGGQNILEPAVWGVPLQHGPFIDDFAEVSRELIDIGIAQVTKKTRNLADAWLRILQNSEDRDKYRQLSNDYFERKAGASHKVWSGIRAYLEA